MELPLHENDLAEPGVLEAHMLHQDGAEIPAVAVLCFFNELLDELAAKVSSRPGTCCEARSVAIRSISTHRRGAVSVIHPGVGAPLAAGFVEEIASLGVSTLVACGGAGALVDHLNLGHVMVVASALRDEEPAFITPRRVASSTPIPSAFESWARYWMSTTSSTSSDARGRPMHFFARRGRASPSDRRALFGR